MPVVPAARSRFDREIVRLALPALGTLATDPLVSLVDTAFVGRLGAVPLAALGVNVALFSFVFMTFNFVSYGTTPRIGRALGRGDRRAAGSIVAHAFVVAAVVGVAVTVAASVWARPLLTLMGVEGALTEPALAYLRIRALAGPALLWIMAAHGAFRGFLDTRTPFAVSLVVAGVNALLDPLLIFVAGWGVAGAAWATVVAQWTGAAIFAWLVVARRTAWQVPFAWPRWHDVAPFLRVGQALLVRTLALTTTMTAATAVATRVGIVEVAAHQIAAQLWMFLALVVDALAVAGQALVARYVGEGDARSARAVSDRLASMAVVLGAVLGVSLTAARPWLVGIFTVDAEVIRATSSVFAFVVLMQPLNALVFAWDGIFMGVEDFAFLARAMVVSAACAAGTWVLLAPFDLGLVGVWWALATLMVARAATMAWRYRPARKIFEAAAASDARSS